MEPDDDRGSLLSRLARTPACWLFVPIAVLCTLDMARVLPHHTGNAAPERDVGALALCEAAAALDEEALPATLELRNVRVTGGTFDTFDPYVDFTVDAPDGGTQNAQTSRKKGSTQLDWTGESVRFGHLGEKPAALAMRVTVYDKDGNIGNFVLLRLAVLAQQGHVREIIDPRGAYLEFDYTAGWLSSGPLALRNIMVTGAGLTKNGMGDSPDAYVYFSIDKPGRGKTHGSTSTKDAAAQPRWTDEVIKLGSLGDTPASLVMEVTIYDKDFGRDHKLGHFALELADLTKRGHIRKKMKDMFPGMPAWRADWGGSFAGYGWLGLLVDSFSGLLGRDVYLEFDYKAGWLSGDSSCRVRPEDHRRVLLCSPAAKAFYHKADARLRQPAIKHALVDYGGDRLRYGAAAFLKWNLEPADVFEGERRWMAMMHGREYVSVDVLEVMAAPFGGWASFSSGAGEIIVLYLLAYCTVILFLVAIIVPCSYLGVCQRRACVTKGLGSRACSCQWCNQLLVLSGMPGESLGRRGTS